MQFLIIDSKKSSFNQINKILFAIILFLPLCSFQSTANDINDTYKEQKTVSINIFNQSAKKAVKPKKIGRDNKEKKQNSADYSNQFQLPIENGIRRKTSLAESANLGSDFDLIPRRQNESSKKSLNQELMPGNNPFYISIGFIYSRGNSSSGFSFKRDHILDDKDFNDIRSSNFLNNSFGWFLAPGLEFYVGSSKHVFMGFETKLYFDKSSLGLGFENSFIADLDSGSLKKGVMDINASLLVSPMFKFGANLGKNNIVSVYGLFGLDVGKVQMSVMAYNNSDELKYSYDSGENNIFGLRGGLGFGINVTKSITFFTEITYGGYLNTDSSYAINNLRSATNLKSESSDYDDITSLIVSCGIKINTGVVVKIPYLIKQRGR